MGAEGNGCNKAILLIWSPCPQLNFLSWVVFYSMAFIMYLILNLKLTNLARPIGQPESSCLCLANVEITSTCCCDSLPAPSMLGGCWDSLPAPPRWVDAETPCLPLHAGWMLRLPYLHPPSCWVNAENAMSGPHTCMTDTLTEPFPRPYLLNISYLFVGSYWKCSRFLYLDSVLFSLAKNPLLIKWFI